MNRYPLTWPQGWRRQAPHLRMNGKFRRTEQVPTASGSSYRRNRDITVADGVARVLEQLRMFGVLEGDAIISTNVQTRLDGLPRSDARKPDDPGVAVYWERPTDHGKTKVMAIDAYAEVADNLAAIAATLEAMRAIERHGGAIILERAFQGFAALPAPGQTHARGWRSVLGIEEDMHISLPAVERIYFKLRSKYHPDKPDGDTERFDDIQKAWAQAQEALAAAVRA